MANNDTEVLKVEVSAQDVGLQAILEKAMGYLKATQTQLGETATTAADASTTMVAGAEASTAAYERMATAVIGSSQAMAASAAQMAATVDKLAASHVALAGTGAASMGKLETATNSAARAFSAMGIQTGYAAERVFALNEAVSALGIGPLGAIAAGLIAIGGAVVFLRDAATEAGHMQSEITSLDVAVRAAGGSISDANGKVQEFTKTAEALGFTALEATSQLNKLVTAGASVHDSMTITSVAMEVARAKHMELAEVVDRLQQAEAGRAIGLARLDVNLKPLIHDHAELSTILAQLVHDMGDQATAATLTYEGALARLHAEWAQFTEDVGNQVLPELTHLTNALIGIVMTLPAVEKAWGEMWSGAVDIVQGAANIIIEYIGNIENAYLSMVGSYNNFVQGNLQASANDFGNAMDQIWAEDSKKTQQNEQLMQRGVTSFETGQKRYKDAIDKTSHAFAQMAVNAAKAAHAITDTHLEKDIRVGNEPGAKGGGAIPDVPTVDEAKDIAPKVDHVVAAQELLKAQLQALSDGEIKYKDAVDLALTAQERDAAQTALTTKVKDDANRAIALITAQMDQEEAEILRVGLANARAKEDIQRLNAAHNALARAINATTKETKEEHREVTDNDRARKAALATFKATEETLKRLGQQYGENVHLLQEYTGKLTDAQKATNALIREYNTMTAAGIQRLADEEATYKKSEAAQRKYWEDQLAIAIAGGRALILRREAVEQQLRDLDTHAYEKGIDQQLRQQQITDEEATYGKSLNAQIQYYEQRLAFAQQFGEEYYGQIVDLEKKIQDLQLDIYKQQVDRQREYADQVADTFDKLIDNVIFKHKSLASQLKDIWQQIARDYMSAMLKSGLENLFQKWFPIPAPNQPNGPGGIPPQGPGSTIWSVIFGGAGGGGAAGVSLPQAVTANTQAATTLDADFKNLIAAVQDLTKALQSSSSGSGFAPSTSDFAAFAGTGNGTADGLISNSSIVSAAVAAASTYGILGALVGSSGASAIVSALPSGSAATSSNSIYAPYAPWNPPEQSGLPQMPGGYPYGTRFEGPLTPGDSWIIYNIFAGQSGTVTPSYPGAAGSMLSGDAASALNSAILGGGASSSIGGGGGGGGTGNALADALSAGFVSSALSGSGGGGGTASQALGISKGGSLQNVLGGGGINLGSGNILSVGGRGISLGTIGQGAALGYTIGSLDNGLFKGQNDSQIGGAIGGAAGAVIGTIFLPGLGTGAGELIGSLIGSAIGGLFGTHTSPATSPDIYDTVRFGTIVADLQGQMGANGQQFYEEGSVRQVTGGATGIAFVEMILAKYGSKSNAPPWLQGYWDQLVSMFGISSSGSGKLQFQRNIGQMSVTGAQGASGIYSYLDYGQALSTFLQAYAQNVGDAGPPAAVYNENRSGSNLGVGSDVFVGTYNPTFGTMTSASSSGGVPVNTGTGIGYGVGGGGANVRAGGSGSPSLVMGGSAVRTSPGYGGAGGGGGVYIDLRGAQVVGPGGMAEFAVILSQALARVAGGEVAGSVRTLGSSPVLRFSGDF